MWSSLPTPDSDDDPEEPIRNDPRYKHHYDKHGKCKHLETKRKAGGGKVCKWCGAVLDIGTSLPFYLLVDGQYFLSSFDDEDEAVIWRVDLRNKFVPHPFNAYRRDGPKVLKCKCGPFSPVVPVEEVINLN
jgi:hypothetical protein